jgi:hypothetical protein
MRSLGESFRLFRRRQVKPKHYVAIILRYNLRSLAQAFLLFSPRSMPSGLSEQASNDGITDLGSPQTVIMIFGHSGLRDQGIRCRLGNRRAAYHRVRNYGGIGSGQQQACGCHCQREHVCVEVHGTLACGDRRERARHEDTMGWDSCECRMSMS